MLNKIESSILSHPLAPPCFAELAVFDNDLLDDAGNLRFIDPLIRLKRPASEIISALVGDAS